MALSLQKHEKINLKSSFCENPLCADFFYFDKNAGTLSQQTQGSPEKSHKETHLSSSTKHLLDKDKGVRLLGVTSSGVWQVSDSSSSVSSFPHILVETFQIDALGGLWSVVYFSWQRRLALLGLFNSVFKYRWYSLTLIYTHENCNPQPAASAFYRTETVRCHDLHFLLCLQ